MISAARLAQSQGPEHLLVLGLARFPPGQALLVRPEGPPQLGIPYGPGGARYRARQRRDVRRPPRGAGGPEVQYHRLPPPHGHVVARAMELPVIYSGGVQRARPIERGGGRVSRAPEAPRPQQLLERDALHELHHDDRAPPAQDPRAHPHGVGGAEHRGLHPQIRHGRVDPPDLRGRLHPAHLAEEDHRRLALAQRAQAAGQGLPPYGHLVDARGLQLLGRLLGGAGIARRIRQQRRGLLGQPPGPKPEGARTRAPRCSCERTPQRAAPPPPPGPSRSVGGPPAPGMPRPP